MVLGDSLSAAYGIDYREGWVSLLEERLDGRGYAVVNASISGDTSRGGLARVDAALQSHRPAVLVLELGGNDGLRGLPVDETRRNLAEMIERAKETGAEVLLVGIELPPNYGPAYTQRFRSIYPTLAETYDVAFVPFLLDGVAAHRTLMQADGIHPRAEAQARILDNVWRYLEPLLQ